MLARNTEWNCVLEQKVRDALRHLFAWLWSPTDDKGELINHDRLSANLLTQYDCIRCKLKRKQPECSQIPHCFAFLGHCASPREIIGDLVFDLAQPHAQP